MSSADGRAVIVFNGEIYNFRELRRELEQAGFAFRTNGDTEVILAAYQRWGVDCLKRLDGMFAFAIFDRDKRQLFLARDRFGVKPLFIAHLSDGSIAFASELKGLLAHPLLRRRVNPQAIEAYMAWGYVPDSHSILAGGEKLPAGHFWRLEQGKAPGRPQHWWDIDFTAREKGSEADLSAQLVHLLREAVRSRMVADVPLGAFLSGGVDSSGVVALMSEASAQPVQTCSIGFDVAAYDETSYARQVAAKFGADHQERIVATDDFAAIDTLAAMFDEPFADASALPTWRVCQLARERVTVALSGDGADEAFAGYRRQVFHHHEERARSAARWPACPAVRRFGPRLAQGRLGAAPPARQGDPAGARGERGGGLCARAVGHAAGSTRYALFGRLRREPRRFPRRGRAGRTDAFRPGPFRPRPRTICRPHLLDAG